MWRWLIHSILFVSLLLIMAGAILESKAIASMALGQQSLISQSEPSMPITFTKNVGQWPDTVLFRAAAGGTTMWIVRDGIYYQILRRTPKPTGEEALAAGLEPRQPDPLGRFRHPAGLVETDMVRARFAGANSQAEVIGLEKQAFTCNYFLGNDPNKWFTNVPNYSGIAFRDIYPGVDATLRWTNGRLEYALVGSAEAVGKTRISYSGAVKEEAGEAVVLTALGEKRFQGLLPVSGTSSITSAKSVTNPEANVTLVYSTCLGGADNDASAGIAVDGSGCAYVTGYTYSRDFPTQMPYQTDQAGGDVFVTKLSVAGNSLLYSTYVGGSDDDAATGIALDVNGNAYVTGQTKSTDYPTLNAYQTDPGDSSYDVFVTKLSAAGNSLIYSTYLGGGSGDGAEGIAVDGSGCAYVTGGTDSYDFPTQNPIQTYQAYREAFVTKLSAAGNSLLYSTFLAGNGLEAGAAIAVDNSGAAYVTGWTFSSNFTTVNPYQTDPGDNNYDVFVTKLSAAGDSLTYSTYLGGSASDFGMSIKVDGLRFAYVVGYTSSPDFPTQTAYQTFQGPTGASFGDAFVTKLSRGGDSLIYSTYLGGSGDDAAVGVAVDTLGSAYVTGTTWSTDFPTQTPYQTDGDGAMQDAFVARLSAAGNNLAYSTYLGGLTNNDAGYTVAVNNAGDAFVTGFTLSTDFPTVSPYQTFQGISDAFVARLTSGCCQGATGNVNMLGIVDLADLSALVSYLTGGGYVLPCAEEANINNTGIVDLSDLSALVSYLTGGGYVLPNCP